MIKMIWKSDYKDREIVIFETHEVTLPEIFNAFKRFLLACGFYIGGEIEDVED